MDIQFYPTSATLAKKAWAKFKRKEIVRLLEPSAGEAHLLAPYLEDRYNSYNRLHPIDCVEIDISKHPILTSKGLNVVGIDFMQFRGASLYSHILLNPPFSVGVSHVMKAWELLFDGELVAILNAESIKNPFSHERRMLVNLIDKHGSVEFLQEEFMSDDTERKTSVEIALIHLKKESDFEMDFLSGLEVDSMSSIGLTTGYKEYNDIAVHQGVIDNSVTAFNAAVKAVREEVFAAAKARYYTNLLGETIESLQAEDADKPKGLKKANLDTVRKELQERYDNLKSRAWTQILRSTQITSRLSSKAQKRLESEFENVKQLEFTVANIHGFILGLINKASDINTEMMLDVFDSITRYHSENRIYYKGYKSNDKHMTSAFKVKTTRFIIPRHGSSFGRSPSFETTRFLADIDKVFAMLAGKKELEVTLESAFRSQYSELQQGARIKTSAFDVRFYPGAGTIHFFPTDKKLIDRFNRMVGLHRKWLPQEESVVAEAFWLQYEQAEKFAADVEAEIAQRNKLKGLWDSIERDIGSNDDLVRETAAKALDEAMDAVLLKHGIDPVALIEAKVQPERQLLLAA